MAAVLHLLKGGDPALALAAIDQQLASGDRVTVALLHGMPKPKLPSAVRVLRVPEEISHEQLLDLIFESAQVITW
jgi:hypothetical protein